MIGEWEAVELADGGAFLMKSGVDGDTAAEDGVEGNADGLATVGLQEVQILTV